MDSPKASFLAFTFALALAGCLASPVISQPRQPGTLRIATFNIFELSCAKIDAVDAQGQPGTHPQVRKAADILRRVQGGEPLRGRQVVELIRFIERWTSLYGT